MKRVRQMAEKYREKILYLFFGGFTTLISIGSYSLLVWMGIEVLAANVLSWILAVLFAYFTNSTWVFEARPAGGRARLRQMAEFAGGRLATLILEEGILLIFVEILAFPAVPVKIAAQAAVLIGNYLISKHLIFR